MLFLGKNYTFQRYDVPKKNADMPNHKQHFKIRNIFQGKFFQDKKHFSAFNDRLKTKQNKKLKMNVSIQAKSCDLRLASWLPICVLWLQTCTCHFHWLPAFRSSCDSRIVLCWAILTALKKCHLPVLQIRRWESFNYILSKYWETFFSARLL